jgi:hypothetical protein
VHCASKELVASSLPEITSLHKEILFTFNRLVRPNVREASRPTFAQYFKSG